MPASPGLDAHTDHPGNVPGQTESIGMLPGGRFSTASNGPCRSTLHTGPFPYLACLYLPQDTADTAHDPRQEGLLPLLNALQRRWQAYRASHIPPHVRHRRRESPPRSFSGGSPADTLHMIRSRKVSSSSLALCHSHARPCTPAADRSPAVRQPSIARPERGL